MDPHAALDTPSPWVVRFVGLIPHGGEVLDLACGGGRHARLLASLGYPVLAVDRDAAMLARAAGPGIGTLQADLESGGQGVSWPFEANRFAGIVVTNYLHRPLFPYLLASLAEGGVLIYETFALGNERFGKPSNPDFLLMPGELLTVAQAAGGAQTGRMRIVAFEDGYAAQPRPAMLQRLCAVKGDPAFESAIEPRLYPLN
jgi:SAM-dependent methyltransferase